MIEIKLEERLVYIVLDAITDGTLVSKNQKKEFSELYIKVDSLKSYFFLSDLNLQERILLAKAVKRYHKMCEGAISFEDMVADDYNGMRGVYKLVRQRALCRYTTKVNEVVRFFEENCDTFIF